MSEHVYLLVAAGFVLASIFCGMIATMGIAKAKLADRRRRKTGKRITKKEEESLAYSSAATIIFLPIAIIFAIASVWLLT